MSLFFKKGTRHGFPQAQRLHSFGARGTEIDPHKLNILRTLSEVAPCHIEWYRNAIFWNRFFNFDELTEKENKHSMYWNSTRFLDPSSSKHAACAVQLTANPSPCVQACCPASQNCWWGGSSTESSTPSLSNTQGSGGPPQSRHGCRTWAECGPSESQAVTHNDVGDWLCSFWGSCGGKWKHWTNINFLKEPN